MTAKYVCADCGNHQDEFHASCERCGSRRLVAVSVAKELFGEDYMKCFEQSKDEQ